MWRGETLLRQKAGHPCDYSIRLNWDGRRTKRASYDGTGDGQLSSPTRGHRPFTIINQTFATKPGPQIPLQQRRRLSGESWHESQVVLNSAHDGGDVSHQQRPASPSNQVFPERDSMQLSPKSTASSGNTAQEKDHILSAMLDPGTRRKEPHDFNTHHFIPIPEPALAGPSPPRDYDHAIPLFRQPQNAAGAIVDPLGVVPALPTTGNGFPPPGDEGNTPLFLRFHPLANLGMPASPLTPMTPSSYSDDDPRTSVSMNTQSTQSNPASPDIRRLTVNSLLSGPPGPIYHPSEGGVFAHNTAVPGVGLAFECDLDFSENARFYGYDLGKRDEDLPRNDDRKAIASTPPTPQTPQDHLHDIPHSAGHTGVAEAYTFEPRYGDRPNRKGATSSGGYYKEPVAIKIPRSLEPLPQKLQENPMNLLHHFLNHTARVLMPYDDQQSNPFRIILPQMAVKNDHLMSLLLAYSASHRARLLQQKEPEMRMALWVQDIFPALREALSDDSRIISNTSLATAIMLASLEIISPKAFGYAIPWQEHLNLARDLMRKRFAGPSVPKITHSSSQEDQVCSFLWSWFTYLDVLGGLSGGPRKSDSSLTLPFTCVDDLDEIDCIMGFTTRCVRLLAETADLARLSDSQRIRPGNTINPAWRPSPETIQRAHNLEMALLDSVTRGSRPCKHIPPENVDGRDGVEMTATNEAFHWAGITQLHRRALGKPSSHPDVQMPVVKIMECLSRIRKGGTAEVGILFPMFTAGCETLDKRHKDQILDRFRNVEKNGMTQIRKARELMVKVWTEDQPWETMLKNEFIG
ncbi:hypothetical protein jhhlp_007401 [Lomentospora prolificans]|uniref:Transcription factor domain-containing protein n=1 Tax=Lomentospora prolificans TaxID=41688 RepID=A0A2N3N2J6_9PEZI|nr:hypothetical protein jhhlp_007401 [Lomentospora prolificans]